MRGFIHRSAITGLAAAVFSSIAIPATAGEALRVRCEQRADRSVVSVDAKNLPDGDYQAEIVSGMNSRLSELQPAVAGEVEFDFSSKPADVAAGATSVARNFVQGPTAGKILAADGFVIVSDTVPCRVR